MRLTSIDVRAVRNLLQVQINPHPGINLFFGDNGAGKTSLLEAVAILSSGRTFRAGKIATVINAESQQLVVSGNVQNEVSGRDTRLGIERGRDSTVARVDGSNAKKLSELAANLPIVVISAKNHELVEGSPTQRRSFMDWTVFLVEHDYNELSRRYKNALLQRNTALRKNQSDALVSSWNTELAACGNKISDYRQQLVNQFCTAYTSLVSTLPDLDVAEFTYRKGWADKETLSDALVSQLPNSRRLGMTTTGPHRADLVIRIRSNEAKHVQSRGQQKLLAILMKMVQVEIYRNHHGHPPIILFDDPPSELDEDARSFVFNYLIASKAQAFLTSIDNVSEEIKIVNEVFHVKHGEVHPL